MPLMQLIVMMSSLIVPTTGKRSDVQSPALAVVHYNATHKHSGPVILPWSFYFLLSVFPSVTST